MPYASTLAATQKAMKLRRRRRRGGEQRPRRDDSFYLAGLRLLAQSDFEEVSIAKLAREAGSSVGAFYYRYPDKIAFLRDVIWRTFRGLEDGLDRRFCGEGPTIAGGILFSEFITDIADSLRPAEVAGVIRAALKLASTDEKALQPYEAYRAQVSDWAEALFASGKKDGGSKKRIQDGMQILFALIEDAILAPNSAPARVGDKRLSEIISDSIVAYTGVSKMLRVSTRTARKPKSRELRDVFAAEKTVTSKSIPDSPRQKQIVKSARRKVTIL